MCEVGPPRAVTTAVTTAGSSIAVSAGARSLATSTNGWPGSGTPGGAAPGERGDYAVPDVPDVAGTLRHGRAEGLELVGHRARRVPHRALRGEPVLPDPPGGARGESRVRGHGGGDREHVGRGARRAARALREIGLHPGCGLLDGPNGFVGRARQAGRPGLGHAGRHPDHRTYCAPRARRNPVSLSLVIRTLPKARRRVRWERYTRAPCRARLGFPRGGEARSSESRSHRRGP